MDNSVSYKAYLDKGLDDGGYEVRRFGIAQDAAANFNYLKEKIRAMFPVLKNNHFFIYWKDNEGDTVAISSDEELVIALSMMCDEKIIKLYLTQQTYGFSEQPAQPVLTFSTKQPVCATFKAMMTPLSSTSAGPQAKSSKTEARSDLSTHFGVICDSCNGSVIGFRYKCMQCPDFDLCASCEGKMAHPEHHMLRIPSPPFTDMDLRNTFSRASKKWIKACHKTAGMKHHQRSGGEFSMRRGNSSCQPRSPSWMHNLSGMVSNLMELHNVTATNAAEVATEAGSAAAAASEAAAAASAARPAAKIQISRNYENGNRTVTRAATAPTSSNGTERPVSEPVQEYKLFQMNELPAPKNLNQSKPDLFEFVEALKKQEEEDAKRQAEAASATRKPSPDESEPKIRKSAAEPPVPPHPEQQTQEKAKADENKTNDADPQRTAFSFEQLHSILQKVVEEGQVPFLTDNPIGCGILKDLNMIINEATGTGGCAQAAQAAGDSANGNVKNPANEQDLGDDEGIRVSAVPGTEDLTDVRFSSRSSDCSVSSQEAEDGWTYFTDPKTSQGTGAIPKNTSTPPPAEEPKEASELPSAPTRLHEDLSPNVLASLNRMLAMGFTNEGGWLEKLLTDRNGSVQEVLEILMPVGPRK